MAFSKGTVSTEGAQIKRYIGVASVCVKGINPTVEELSAFYGREVTNLTDYVGTREVNGKQVPQVRIDFLVQADPDKYEDIDLKQRVSFFLTRAPRVSSAGKTQVIDKYGRTAWATPEELKDHKIPVYSNGKAANLDSNYRVAYDGEEALIKFLIAYLNIPDPANYVNGEWVMKSAADLADCEATLEHVEDYFKGNIQELKDIIAYQPNNRVKVLFGVRTADDGKQYQAVYTRSFMRNSSSSYNALTKDVTSAKANGAYPSTEFVVEDIKEYTVTPTEFKAPEADPFGGPAAPWD